MRTLWGGDGIFLVFYRGSLPVCLHSAVPKPFNSHRAAFVLRFSPTQFLAHRRGTRVSSLSPAEHARAAGPKTLCKMCSSTFLDDEESLARWLALRGSLQGSRLPVLDNNEEVIGHRGNTEQYSKSIGDQRSRDLVARRLALP